MLVNAVRSKGSMSLADLRVALDAASLTVKVDDAQLFHALQRIPELFFMPEVLEMFFLFRVDILFRTPSQSQLLRVWFSCAGRQDSHLASHELFF